MGKLLPEPIKLGVVIFMLIGVVETSALNRETWHSNFACEPPIVLFAQATTTTTATLNWSTPSSSSPVDSWEIELIHADSAFSQDATHTNIITRPFTVDNLQPGTRYNFRVKAVCQFGEAWSTQTGSFVTDLTSPSPCGMKLPIQDNGQEEFPVLINNAPGTAMGLDVLLREVRVIINHNWEIDLDIFLISPSGIEVELSTDNGGAIIGSGYGDLTAPGCGNYTAFSSAYPNDSCRVIASITDNSLPDFNGLFYPEEPLPAFNDNSNPNGEWILRIVDDQPENRGTLEYVELVFSSFDCQAPGYIDASNIRDTAIRLDWNASPSCLGAIVEYGPPGFTPGMAAAAGNGGTIITGVCPPYDLTGLTAVTEYDIYVRQLCSNGAYSENSCLLNITTACNTTTPSLVENFDSQGLCTASCGSACPISGVWTNAKDDNFDWTVYAGSTPSENTGPSDDVTNGGRYIYLETSNTPCWGGRSAGLRSECIEIHSGGAGCDLSFFYHMFGSTINSLTLEISLNGGLTWTGLRTIQGNQGNSWKRAYVDLSAFDGKIAQFRFVGKGGDGRSGNIAIDQIEFYGSQNTGTPNFRFFADNDGDGFGNPASSITVCLDVPPSGYVADNTDCNDNNAAINPEAPEVYCNKIDENCNGIADDTIFPDPEITADTICSGTSSNLSLSVPAQGKYYWFDAPRGGTVLKTGSNFTTPPLNQSKSYYVADSSIVAPGLRLTEVDLNSVPGIEIQSIGIGGNYTGWKVAFGCSDSNINSVNPVFWRLGVLGPGQVDYRSLADLGSNCFWLRFLAGWVMLIDNKGKIADVIFWKWPASAIKNFNTTIDGVQYTAADLPWSGPGINTFSCDGSNTINLSGSEEKNNALDYSCMPNTMGTANTGINMTYICKSNRVKVDVVVDLLEASAEIIPNICDKSHAGDIDVSTTGGIGNIGYSWNDGSKTEDLLRRQAGTYAVTISDGQGCSTSIDNMVLEPPSFEFSVDLLSFNNPSCSDSDDGSIEYKVSDGTAPYSFKWSDGTVSVSEEQVATLQNLVSGVFDLSVTDANGCSSTGASVNLSPPEPLSISLDQIKNTTCPGSDDGSLSVVAGGGSGAYTYGWDNDVRNTSFIDQLAPGTYQLTLTDANGCSLISESYLISEPASFSLTVDDVQHVICKGDASGSIATTLTGGTPPYSFDWGPGIDPAEDPANLPGGNYRLSLTDGNGCTFIADTVITIAEAPEPLTMVYTQEMGNPCDADPRGDLLLEVSGGVQPYTYIWSNGHTGKDLFGVVPDVYGVTITDQLGCSFIHNDVSLQQAYSDFQVNLFVLQPVECFGESDGVLIAQVTNGIEGNYQFNWSIGLEKDRNSFSDTLTGLRADFYSVTVTGPLGCVASSRINLNDVPPIRFAPQVTAINCYGELSGSIVPNVSGGQGPYSYQWSNGAQTRDLLNAASGNYSLTVTDAAGCVAEMPAQIRELQSAPLTPRVLDVQSVSCAGAADGSIRVIVAGGTPLASGLFEFDWSNGANSQNLEQLPGGAYSLTVTDANNCQAVLENILVEESAASLKINEEINPATCPKSNDGSILLNVSGGTPPYHYRWDFGGSGPAATGLAPRKYIVTVTDAKGCRTISNPIQVESVNTPDFIQYAIDSVVVVSPGCYGASTGRIAIQMDGGNASYNFNWNTGDAIASLSGLQAGVYIATVSNMEGCFDELRIQLREPDSPLSIDQITALTNEPSDCGANTEDGSTVVEAMGGTPPYRFFWQDSISLEAGVDKLGPGLYGVTVTDDNGCMDSLKVEFCTTSVANPAHNFEKLVLYPNPGQGLAYLDIALFESAEVGIEVYSMVGQRILFVPPRRIKEEKITLDLNHQPDGIYFIRIIVGGKNASITKKLVVFTPGP